MFNVLAAASNSFQQYEQNYVQEAIFAFNTEIPNSAG